MNALTLDLLQRVKSLVPEESGWFNTLRTWYKNVKFTRRLIDELRTDEETALLNLKVGDTPVSATPECQGRHIHWLIPAESVSAGSNFVQITLDEEAQRPLLLDASFACQDKGLANQTLDLSVPSPRSTHYLEMSDSGEARHQADCWAVFPTGFLRFQLHLPSRGPVHFTLRMPEGQSLPWPKSKAVRRQQLLEDVIERVKKRVEKKMTALEEELRQSRSAGGEQAANIESDLNDLRAYEELHRRQIESLVRAAASITLEYVIRETGLPDDLIRRFFPRSVTQPPPLPSTPPTGPAKPAPRPPRANVPAAPASGMFGNILFLTAILSTAGMGFVIWQDNETRINAAWTGFVAWINPDKAGANGNDVGLQQILANRGAQGGEVQVSLFWHNKNDLDLHVVSPFKENGNQEEVWWMNAQKNKRSPSGGQLDVDANAGMNELRDDPIENIHWPAGQAPRGTYKVYVVLFGKRAIPGCEDPTRFTVRIVIRGNVRVVEGTISSNEADKNPMGKARVLVTSFDVGD